MNELTKLNKQELIVLRYINKETTRPIAWINIKYTDALISLENRRILNIYECVCNEYRVVLTSKHLNGETLNETYKGI